MRITIQDDFDLQKIADSGQCFRFNKCGEGYSVVAGDKYLFRVEFYSTSRKQNIRRIYRG